MKNKQTKVLKRHSLLAIALVAVIAFTFTACGDLLDLLGGGGGGGSSSNSATYTGTANNGSTYKLVITPADRAITPSTGDNYVLTVGTKRSTGTVDRVSGNTFTLRPQYYGAQTFSATVSGNGLTDVSGLITFDTGETEQGPSELTPVVVTPPPINPDPDPDLGGGGGNNGSVNKMVLNNGSAKDYIDNKEIARATYTTSGNTITMTGTEIHGSMFSGMVGFNENQWYNEQQTKTALKSYFNSQMPNTPGLPSGYIDTMIDEYISSAFKPQDGTYTLNGNKLTIGWDMTVSSSNFGYHHVGTAYYNREGTGSGLNGTWIQEKDSKNTGNWPPSNILSKYGLSGLTQPSGSNFSYTETGNILIGDVTGLTIMFTATSASANHIKSYFSSNGWESFYGQDNMWTKSTFMATFNIDYSDNHATLSVSNSGGLY